MAAKESGRYTSFEYALTGNPDEVDNDLDYSKELGGLLRKTFMELQFEKEGMKEKLDQLIKEYPNVPAFKNYLSFYYKMRGKLKEAYVVNGWLVKEHPDYLHGKLNLAAQYLAEKRYEKIPEILGEALDLKDMYPQRKVFHYSEFEGLLRISCKYLIETGNLEAAESRIRMADAVLKGSPILGELKENLETAQQQNQRAEELDSEENDQARSRLTQEIPEFNHPEIEELYHRGMDIEHSILRKIISLPEETLVEDLKAVLMDSVSRHEDFQNKLAEEPGINGDEITFPIHALFLLTELNSDKAFAVVLDYLRQDSEVLDFWLSFHYAQTIWRLLYHLGKNRLNLLQSFMKESGIFFWSKTATSAAVVQIGFHHPEQRANVIEWYRNIFEFFLENEDDKELADPELISFLVLDIADFRTPELLPLIKQFYERDLIDRNIVLEFGLVKDMISLDIPIFNKEQVFDNMYDRYQYVFTTWFESEEEWQADEGWEDIEQFSDYEEEEIDDYPRDETFPQTVKRDCDKVGRNDPCPCGSGKKYKKCCWKKDRV